MRINQFIKRASIGLMLTVLLVVVSSFSAGSKASAMKKCCDYCTGASYNVSYDSFVYGALPIWIDRSCDEGPSIVTVQIRIEGGGTYYEDIYVDGTYGQQTFNQYSGPYFVEVSIDHVTYL